ncbi:MAG TPA: tRNA (guanosine(37)-N1)-methyltransferase TrmD, partial [Umezawaea sp.]|nr:tRNA (guanosine(37)-N1)-methyltransferase TrmD [Umezawaea sp.]
LIDRWRRDQSLERTLHRRPELLEALPAEAFDKHDRALLDRLRSVEE